MMPADLKPHLPSKTPPHRAAGGLPCVLIPFPSSTSADPAGSPQAPWLPQPRTPIRSLQPVCTMLLRGWARRASYTTAELPSHSHLFSNTLHFLPQTATLSIAICYNGIVRSMKSSTDATKHSVCKGTRGNPNTKPKPAFLNVYQQKTKAGQPIMREFNSAL